MILNFFLARKENVIFAFSVFADGGILYDLLYGRMYQTKDAVTRAWPRLVTSIITKSYSVYYPKATVVLTSKVLGGRYPETCIVQADKAAINLLLSYAEECYKEYLNWRRKWQ